MVRYQRKTGLGQKLKAALSWAVTFLVLFVIVLLAIPACLLVMLISGVWNLADSLLRRMDG